MIARVKATATPKAKVKANSNPQRSESLDSFAQHRIDHFAKGVATAGSLDPKASKLIAKQVHSDPGLRKLKDTLTVVLETHGRLSQEIANGKRTIAQATPEWQKAFAPLLSAELRQIRGEFEASLPPRLRNDEAKMINALFDDDQRAGSIGWSVEGDVAGPAFYSPRARPRRPLGDHPEYEPPPNDTDNPGTPSAPEPPPIAPTPVTDCAGPPFTLERINTRAGGLGPHSSSAGARPASGLLTCFASSSSVIVGAAGSYAEAAVGRTIAWPAGFSGITLTATVNVTASLFSAMVLAGAAGAGADVFLDYEATGGTPIRRVVPIGAVVSPILFFASADIVRTFTVIIPIGIVPGPGSARMLAGVSLHTEAGGIGGGGSNGSVVATVTSLCFRMN